MIDAQYTNDTTVYNFYFDWNSNELKYKTLVVVGFNYVEENNTWNVIDEYTLIEEYVEKKFFLFKKKKFKTHKIKSHLISDNIQFAKVKFLYYFINTFNDLDFEYCATNIKAMMITANKLYNDLIENNPDIIFRAMTAKISDDNVIYWR